MKKFAVGMIIKDRWDLTENALNSIYYSDQISSSFDIFLIDNGSSPENTTNLRDFIKAGLLDIKNVFLIKEMSVPKAWNLFLAITKNYQYRVKFDNDLVLARTIAATAVKDSEKRTSQPKRQPTPIIGGTNPGAIPSGPPIRGLGQTKKQNIFLPAHTQFLHYMEDFGKDNNADIVALAPVSPGQTFMSQILEIVRRKFDGLPYLFGACMMISKQCFDKLGYFDERLERRIDVEYTQRAVRNGINIGYHNYYFVSHIGAFQSTEPRKLIDLRCNEAIKIGRKTPIKCYCDSMWEKALPALNQAVATSNIVTLN